MLWYVLVYTGKTAVNEHPCEGRRVEGRGLSQTKIESCQRRTAHRLLVNISFYKVGFWRINLNWRGRKCVVFASLYRSGVRPEIIEVTVTFVHSNIRIQYVHSFWCSFRIPRLQVGVHAFYARYSVALYERFLLSYTYHTVLYYCCGDESDTIRERKLFLIISIQFR